MSSLRKFFIHYSHFLTGNALNLMVGLVSFPILTRILTREEYGMLGLVTTTMFLSVAVAKAGLSDGIVRFYREYSESPESRDIFSSTIMIRGLVLSLMTVSLYVIIVPFTYRYLQINDRFLICFIIMAAYLFLRPLNIIVLNILRVVGKTIFFNITNFIGKIAAFTISLILLIYIVGEFYGYFVGLVLSELLVSSILFVWFFKSHKIIPGKVSGRLALKLVKFGFPLLITELSFLLLSYADRYMIAVYQGGDALGLYSVGHNIASYISDMMMFSLSYAFIPIYVAMYEKEGKEKTAEFLQKCMHYLLVAIIPMCIGYFLVSRDLLVILASDKYVDAADFSPIILLGAFFLGMNNILNAGLYLQKKTKAILGIMLSAVAINITLNLFLLPVYGVMGAAVSTLAACMASSFLTIFLSFRYLAIKVNMQRIFFHVVLSGIMFFLVSHIALSIIWMNLIAKMFAGVLIISLGVLLIERDIRTKVGNILLFKKTRYGIH